MKTSLFVLLLFLSVNAFAHGGSGTIGDGGHGVKCSDGSVQLLDLFEARSSFASSWSKKVDSKNYQQILEEKKHRLASILQDEPILAAFDKAIRTKIRIEPSKFKTTVDYRPLQVEIPANCKIVQIGFHRWIKNFGAIIFDELYLNGLSQEDLAALLLHEQLHGYFTDTNKTLIVRQLIGYIFADEEFQSRNKDAFLNAIFYETPARFK